MSDRVRRALLGSGAAVVVTAALSASMLPERSHLSVATAGLVLVVPVVVGVVVGGFGAGVVAVGAGFLVYDVLFIPPYGELSVGRSQNWVALGVYAAVVLLVARVVAELDSARVMARRQERHVRRLFELSDLLVAGQRDNELFVRIVESVRDTFSLTSVLLLLHGHGELVPVALSGAPWSEGDLHALVPRAGVPVHVGLESGGGVRAVALAATGQPVGMLGLRGRALHGEERELLRTFANHIALTLERAQLQAHAVRADVLEDTERLQKALVGAVSHDLQTPLSTIKLSASMLRDPAIVLDPGERDELVDAIDTQAGHLSRLVTNLLDMTRVQAGALRVTRSATPVDDLVSESLERLQPLVGGVRLTVDVQEGLPPVDVDHLLVGQVLANLVENATRYAPEGTDVEVSARLAPHERVEVAVADRGPGVPCADHAGVFELFHRTGPGQGTGVGLAIAKAFVEAHGESIWVEDRPGGGASFCFTLPVAAALSEPV